jgi:hypothetical protein
VSSVTITLERDGHTYRYEQDEQEPFRWALSVDGKPMTRTSENLNGATVLWQLALEMSLGVGP